MLKAFSDFSGYLNFKQPLTLDTGGQVAVSTAKRLYVYNSYMQRPFPNGNKYPFGCNSYVTAMAVAVAAGQSQRLYSSGAGAGIFSWYYLNLPPQVPRRPPESPPLESQGREFITAHSGNCRAAV